MTDYRNKHDHNYLATFLMEQQQVVILDIRAPSVPVAELAGHSQCVNTLAWAPHSSCHICFGVDTRVLTSHGFKFVHEIETMLASNVNVEYACYDVSRRELVYGPGKLVLPTSTPKELVSFSHDSNHLELKVTAEHQVYCQVGTVGDAGHTQWPITSKAEGRKQISAVAGAGKVRAADLQSARRRMESRETTPLLPPSSRSTLDSRRLRCWRSWNSTASGSGMARWTAA